MRNRMKNKIIIMLIIFSTIVVSIVTGMFYLNLKSTMKEFNNSIVSSNEKVVLNLLEKSRGQGEKLILKSNENVVNNTKEKLNNLILGVQKENDKAFQKLFASTLEREIAFIKNDLKVLVNSPEFWWEKRYKIEKKIINFMGKNKNIKSIKVYNNELRNLVKLGSFKYSFNSKSINKILKKKRFYYSSIFKNNTMYIAVPVKNEDKYYKGFLIAQVKVTSILRSVLDSTDLGSDKNIYVLSKNADRVIKHKNSKYDGIKFSAVSFNKEKRFQQRITKDRVFSIYRYQNSDLRFYVVIKSYLSDYFSYVDNLKKDSKKIINKSFKEFDGNLKKEIENSYNLTQKKSAVTNKNFLKRIAKILIVVFLLGIFISIIIGAIIANGISSPIKKLSYFAKRIGEGQFDYYLEEKLLNRKDELGELSVEFSNMKEKLKGDISKIRELERKKAHTERLSIMGQVVSGIVHEIKNPLTSISGFAQIIGELSNSPEIQKHSKTILDETIRLNRLTIDLLNYAKTRKIEYERIRIKILIESVLEKLAPKIANKSIEIDLQISDNLPPVYGDRDKITQIFINLISNSIEATKKLDGKLSISGNRMDDEIVFRIKDDGKGIPKEIQDKIFLPFVSNKKAGTGLGLAMVQKIITDHNGAIKLNKELQEGTEFIMRLPIKQEDKE